MTTPQEYNPERHDPPPVLNVHHAALQEVDNVVGNRLTLDEEDTSRLRRIIFSALSEAHLAELQEKTVYYDHAGNDPEAVVERHGRWWHLVYIRHGFMRGGPGGHGWHVLGARRANRKARKVLAKYVRQQTPLETTVIRADDLGSVEG